MTDKSDGTCEVNIVDEGAVIEVKKDMLPEDMTIDLSQIFKALGDPTRLKIIYALSKKDLCVCDIAEILDMSQSAISHQLRVLRNLRLVKYRKEGKSAIYSLDDDHVLTLFNQGIEHILHQ
ncbi:ArsR/SmtB family transcription factor [Dethiothermospora halolimnae]|uniref:ArsR/SmtB family transcription factor n=1 Tax=Dethiothermospora halolimnae TaxID=3114390 RepID=UPI003CCC40C9